MRYLLLTTLIWAFSFSFIGEILAGRVDSYFAVLVRIGLASLVFLPFTKFRGIDKALKVKIMLIGSVQIGFMYIFFYQSFLFLSVPEVILFTIFTPIYVTLIYDGLKRQFNPRYLVSTGMAVLGAYIIRYQNVDSAFITGFLMVQGANICFALGQSAYKKVMESNPKIIHSDVFGYFYFGALLVGIVAFALLSDHSKLSPTLLQWSVLLWLGIVASGIGYFLWNKGACDVDAGVLGIMNNALVPAGLMMNLLLWKTPVDYVSLSIGSGIILFSLVFHYRLINRKHAL